jgi:hypothetical protein
MLRNKVIACVLLAAVLISGEAYCQQVNTVTGKVIYVDAEGSVINVQTDTGKMVFYISVESNLIGGTHPIASIDIERGDPVQIQYSSSASGQNNIISLVDTRLYID